PYALQPVFSAKTPKEKLAQRQYFFWYKPEEQRNIEQSLHRIGRPDLIKKLFPNGNHRTEHHPERPEEKKRRRHHRHP
ncbi:MAG: YgiQ family radical SAM protein, partial [Prevotella sp.]|nr:YgiQ family radical SAM protein [Prevotella sp.]